MADASNRPSAADPFGLWKQMLEAQEEDWSRIFQQMMGTEAFAAGLGRYLDNLMNVQGSVDQALDRQFRALNLPSRADFTRLATEVADLRAAVNSLAERIADLQDQIGRPAADPRPAKAPSDAVAPRGSRSRTGTTSKKEKPS